MTKSAGAAATCNQRPSGAPSRLADVRAGKGPADDREPEIEATDGRIDQHARVGAVERPVDEREADPTADDRPRHDPTAMKAMSSTRSPPPRARTAASDERQHDRQRERDRPPADRQIAEQLSERVEVEDDDGDRHGGLECIEGEGVGLPTLWLSAQRSPSAGARRQSSPGKQMHRLGSTICIPGGTRRPGLGVPAVAARGG